MTNLYYLNYDRDRHYTTYPRPFKFAKMKEHQEEVAGRRKS
ncbi:unnamed protein product [Amoebophrya sp. A25]|nr:unnamed protein product [Amoebophrya sp. A25]|eukprot:GSA25T00010768001.1